MAESYHVRVSKDELVFSAGHFITYDGDVCERLHGHNYSVAGEVSGPLDKNSYVINFITLRDALKAIIAELDHRMLLPTQHPLIKVRFDDDSVEATFRDRRWVFPRGDCVLLPVANTTAELLARHIAHELREALVSAGNRPELLRIEVDECFGQVASCELRPG